MYITLATHSGKTAIKRITSAKGKKSFLLNWCCHLISCFSSLNFSGNLCQILNEHLNLKIKYEARRDLVHSIKYAQILTCGISSYPNQLSMNYDISYTPTATVNHLSIMTGKDV